MRVKRAACEGGEMDMVARLKTWLNFWLEKKMNQNKPVIRLRIQGQLVSDVKWLIAEMNKEYGESHTLYIEVKF